MKKKAAVFSIYLSINETLRSGEKMVVLCQYYRLVFYSSMLAAVILPVADGAGMLKTCILYILLHSPQAGMCVLHYH